LSSFPLSIDSFFLFRFLVPFVLILLRVEFAPSGSFCIASLTCASSSFFSDSSIAKSSSFCSFVFLGSISRISSLFFGEIRIDCLRSFLIFSSIFIFVFVIFGFKYIRLLYHILKVHSIFQSVFFTCMLCAMKFKAAMFDFDGTITKKGLWEPDPRVVAEFGRLLDGGFPIAICTGRQLSSFDKRFTKASNYLKEHFGEEVFKNFYYFGENGSVGYEYAGVGGGEDGTCWKRFYLADWPSEVPKEKFETGLIDLLKDKAEFLTHLVPIVIGPIGRMEMKIEDVYDLSDELYHLAFKYMKEFETVGGGNALDYLRIGDSGLGCLIVPVNGDKDSSVPIFHNLLKDRGFEFADGCEEGECREILVVGDNGMTGGNDYYFLNGRYGTAYCVGEEIDEGVQWPKQVLDADGKVLLNSDGVVHLLKEIVV
jgi:hypothetical protein